MKPNLEDSSDEPVPQEGTKRTRSITKTKPSTAPVETQKAPDPRSSTSAVEAQKAPNPERASARVKAIEYDNAVPALLLSDRKGKKRNKRPKNCRMNLKNFETVQKLEKVLKLENPLHARKKGECIP